MKDPPMFMNSSRNQTENSLPDELPGGNRGMSRDDPLREEPVYHAPHPFHPPVENERPDQYHALEARDFSRRGTNKHRTITWRHRGHDECAQHIGHHRAIDADRSQPRSPRAEQDRGRKVKVVDPRRGQSNIETRS